jgi:hypothetical protein
VNVICAVEGAVFFDVEWEHSFMESRFGDRVVRVKGGGESGLDTTGDDFLDGQDDRRARPAVGRQWVGSGLAVVFVPGTVNITW